MKTIVSAIVVALTMTTLPALALTSNANVATPSAQNSGVGIPGFAGSEDGPAIQHGTVGSGATARQYNLSIREQDVADISGPAGNGGRSIREAALTLELIGSICSHADSATRLHEWVSRILADRWLAEREAA